MRAHRLRLDSRGRVLLTPAMRAAVELEAGARLAVEVEDGELLVRPDPGDAPDVSRGRSPTLDRKGRLTLPGSLRQALGLATGATLLLRVDPPGLRLVTPGRLFGRIRAARIALNQAMQG